MTQKSKLHRSLRLVSLTLALAASITASSAQAQELTGTLKKIKDSASITLGARESSAPFSYSIEGSPGSPGSQYVGYSVDLMMKIVERLKTELKLPKLDVKVIPFTAQNRIPLVVNGTLDLECSSTTNTLERQKQVAFSNSIFIIGTRLITAKDSGIKDFADLKGRNVAVTAGTTSDRLLNKFNDDKQMGINVLAVKENSLSFLAVETGRAVAFMMDDAILFGERATSKDPARWAVVGTPLSREAYGCMMKKDDAPFKKIVDATLAELMTSGQIKPIYQKWFEKPIPPRNVLLGFAASDDVSRLWAKPNDQSIE